jgi:hypothetical protein
MKSCRQEIRREKLQDNDKVKGKNDGKKKGNHEHYDDYDGHRYSSIISSFSFHESWIVEREKRKKFKREERPNIALP